MKPHVPDIKALSLREIGIVLLEEGQLLESEEVFDISRTKCEKLPSEDQQYMTKNLRDEIWSFSAITQAMGFWSRFAVTCRRGEQEDIKSLIGWKTNRTPLKLFLTKLAPKEEVAQIADYYDTVKLSDSGKRLWKIEQDKLEAAKHAWVFDKYNKVELSPPLSPRELIKLDAKMRKFRAQRQSMEDYKREMLDINGSFDEEKWKK